MKATDMLREAELMIEEGERSDAEKLLKRFVKDMPSDWKPVTETFCSIDIAYWDVNEFSCHSYRPPGDKTMVVWITPSYSKAFYLLAFLKVERKEYTEALDFIEQGLLLEPDHPLLWCEKALILNYLEQHEEAYRLFMKAASIRPWIPAEHKARALRGAGVALIDLNRLDEAEEVLRESLVYEPDSFAAKNELGYVDHLRKGRKPSEEQPLYSKPRRKIQ